MAMIVDLERGIQIPAPIVSVKQSTEIPSLEKVAKASSHEDIAKEIDALIKKEEEIGSKFERSKTFFHPEGTVIAWPNRDILQMTDSEVGVGLTKTVYKAWHLRTRKAYACACVGRDEINAMLALKNKRGIAQIHNHASGQFWMFDGSISHQFFYYGELYDTDLSKHLHRCSLEDIKVIVKDLVYALIALEGEDPVGDWIQHGDIKDANVFLKIDQTSKRVTGAYLGDFGLVAMRKTVVIDEEARKEEKKRFGRLQTPQREAQRAIFMGSLFQRINFQVQEQLDQKVSLEDLCADDPICKKFMGEMQKAFGHVLEQDFVHWID